MVWLWGICMNVVREMRRRRGSDPVQGLDLDVLTFRADAGPMGERNLAGLFVAIERLPARQREAVTCRYLRRLSVRETAAVMGCAEGTVKATVAAALGNLRDAPALPNLDEDREDRHD